MAKRGGRAAKAVNHAVAAEEKNIIWEACEGIFKPVKSKAARDAEEAAAKKGRKIADARSGEPVHKTDLPRVTKGKQKELAEDMGYKPYEGPTKGAKEPVFYKEGGDPPYISYDHTGHGAAQRGEDGPVKVPWKGSDSPKGFGKDDRAGTYNPEYDDGGNVVFKRGRR